MKTTFFTVAALLLTAAGSFYACREKEAGESNEPVVISFTEYSLTGTSCQWANLSYDNKVIVINSSVALESYLTGTRSSYPAIDFSKHSLLLASGTANNAVFGISAKDLQQLVNKDYELSIEIILNPAIVNGQWVFALFTDKLNGDKKVELNASYKNCEDCGDGGDGCEFENPLSDLPWLKAIIDNFEDEAIALGYNPHARIYQCSYNAGIGFLLEMCVGCPGEGYSFRNCEGVILCSEGNCSGLNIDFAGKKLIWEKEEIVEVVYPIDIPFEEYSLIGTSCTWEKIQIPPSPPNAEIIIINSVEKLEEYIKCTGEYNYPIIDFSKFTLLLSRGVQPYLVFSDYYCQSLQQISAHNYLIKINLHTGLAAVITYWQVPITVDKIADDSMIELIVTKEP